MFKLRMACRSLTYLLTIYHVYSRELFGREFKCHINDGGFCFPFRASENRFFSDIQRILFSVCAGPVKYWSSCCANAVSSVIGQSCSTVGREARATLLGSWQPTLISSLLVAGSTQPAAFFGSHRFFN